MPTAFGDYAYDQYNNNAIRDSYLLFSSGQQIEFYARTINGPVPSTIPVSSIRYSISTILPTSVDYQSLTGYENTNANRIGDGILHYVKCAENRGVVVGVT